jgi:hypothetical protein
MLRRVAVVRTGVSEERSASIIRVIRIGEIEILAVTSNRRTLPLTRETWRNIPEEGILHSQRREKIKYYNLYGDFVS